MLNTLEFDTTKYYLGKPCKRGHKWGDSGKTLRYNNRHCVRCQQEYTHSYNNNPDKQQILKRRNSRYYHSEANRKRQENRKDDPMLIINRNAIGEKHYLGRLCRFGHEWEKTGMSMRLRVNSACVECKVNQERQRLLRIKEQCAESFDGVYYLGDLCRKQHRHKNTNQSLRFTIDGNCVCCRREGYRAYQKTIKGKARDTRMRHRRRAAVNQTLSLSPSIDEINQRFEYFDHRCAYCDKGDQPLTLDHFFALTRGGIDHISNIIPCCKSCNSSKNNSDPWEWYSQKPFYSCDNWLRILNVLDIDKKID